MTRLAVKVVKQSRRLKMARAHYLDTNAGLLHIDTQGCTNRACSQARL